MIITKTPLRISFAGGMSDLPSFYKNEPGAVITTSIDKYIYITVNKKFDDDIRASYSITEFAKTPDDLNHELIRESLKLVGVRKGIEITSISDIPSKGTGLGSSSSYTVGLLNALYSHLGVRKSAEFIANQACNIEINKCKKTIGKQDQYIASYGGLKYIQFNPDGSVFVDPIICSNETKNTLQNNLLFFYTGMVRKSNNILSKVSSVIDTNIDKQNRISKLVSLAKDMKLSLENNDLSSFGDILNESWEIKKETHHTISNEIIDTWYQTGINNGAMGGKLCGAGSGGFLLFYAPREHHKNIEESLPELKKINMKFEPQGSKIIYVE
jgi:D-glycero-alpha-D-manno-heptose-7-phosphate kinase